MPRAGGPCWVGSIVEVRQLNRCGWYLWTALIVSGTARAEPNVVVRLDDPAGDDHGPGRYEYPSDTFLFPRGTFDLRGLEVAIDGDEVVFKVTLGHKIQRPPVVKRTNAVEIPLDNGIYVQNVDILLDTDPGPGIGFTQAVPGRNVEIDKQNAWDVAVVLTPQPFPTRSALEEWAPVRKVIFARQLVTIGNTVTARVGLVDLGGLPSPHWGYQVLVTGAIWEATFDVINRYVLDQQVNAFTMRVQTVAEDRAFGGGELHLVHPFVIDMLAPEGRRQEAILAGFDGDRKRLAVIPLVYPDPQAHAKEKKRRMPAIAPSNLNLKPTTSSAVELIVRDVKGELVILERKNEAPKAFEIGVVVAADGREIGKVVVTSVYPEFVAATAVAGASSVEPGLRVRFEPRPPAKQEVEK